MRILFYILLLFLYSSCVRKKENVEQTHDTFQEISKGNELYAFFNTKIKGDYLKDVNAGAKYFYFRFKQTDLNDTIFQFSYFITGYANSSELGYKGFLKIDSFNVAIYDEKDLMVSLYKDSLCIEPFPKGNKFTGVVRENSKFVLHLHSIGWLKNNKLETLPSIEVARKEWNRYFD